MLKIKKTSVLVLLIGFIFLQGMHAQQPEIMNGVETRIALKKLLTLGSVLYIAAHPDDENTAILAYMSKEKMMRTGYLALTRGDGGQNLVGSEKGPLMGLIRTYELLGARKIDGAEQLFTRAIDFGYSKTSEESIAIWGKEKIIEDIVFVIRKFQPDIIMVRFPAQDEGGGGHGHHSASTILALEAFNASGDPLSFPEQLKYVEPWKAKRILWNTWRPYMEGAKPEEVAKLLSVDVGKYNRMLGKSYTEIASKSRSMHKSQGFGSVPFRGQRLDYFSVLAGEPATSDIFEGTDTTWNRVKGSEMLRSILEKADKEFDATQPQKVLPLLIDAYTELQKLGESYWTVRKMGELKEVIRSCAGLWLETMCTADTVTPGQEITVNAEMINRSDFPFTLKKIVLPSPNDAVEIGQVMSENISIKKEFKMKFPELDYTHPYWLKEKPEKGIYPAADPKYKGLAVAPYPAQVTVVLEAKGREITFDVPLLYRLRDPVEGEKIRWLNVSPPVTVNFKEPVFYFPGKEPRAIEMVLRSGPFPVSGEVSLELPPGWKMDSVSVPFSIDTPLTEREISIKVIPSQNESKCEVTASVKVQGKLYNRSQVVIEYPHLPLLILHPKAECEMVRVNMNGFAKGKRLGYIMGSGDEIPQYLEQVGFRMELLTDDLLRSANLSIYDAIITGVRAYNTRDVLKHVQPKLMEYVKNGGRLIVQYNTSRGLLIPQIGPYPLQLSQDRVTEEDATVTLLDPFNPVLLNPNKIAAGDFEGWVQERGLYFADKWDPQYKPLLACNDKNEKPKEGGMLRAKYGKGIYIYTGYAFFRQIPAGVPGALKLFVNMLLSK